MRLGNDHLLRDKPSNVEPPTTFSPSPSRTVRRSGVHYHSVADSAPLISCLAEALGEPAGASFTVRVSLLSTTPYLNPDAEDLDLAQLMSNAPSSLGGAGAGDEFEWQFSVKLADDTCEVPAVIAGSDGSRILGDPNSLFSSSKATRNKARKDAAAGLRDAVGEDKTWQMTLKSASVGGIKVFAIRATEGWERVE